MPPLRKKKSIIFSKFAIIILFLILAGVLTSFIKIKHRKRQVENEIKNFQNEIAKLEKRNVNLENLLNYLSQNDYLERQAREHLNLKKSGENIAVILTPELKEEVFKNINKQDKNNSDGVVNTDADDKFLNLKKWWEYFFE